MIQNQRPYQLVFSKTGSAAFAAPIAVGARICGLGLGILASLLPERRMPIGDESAAHAVPPNVMPTRCTRVIVGQTDSICPVCRGESCTGGSCFRTFVSRPHTAVAKILLFIFLYFAARSGSLPSGKMFTSGGRTRAASPRYRRIPPARCRAIGSSGSCLMRTRGSVCREMGCFCAVL